MGIGTVQTRYGEVSGVDMRGYTLFKGIPYAKPPIGKLRFSEPAAPDSWQGVYRADHFAPACIQDNTETGGFYDKEFYSTDKPVLSEDCLYLNIWTPAENKGEKLPVAFWIHGGAFSHGYGHEIEFDGESYCKKGVILVTINYRLGALGFLVHPWLMQESRNGAAGNYGILDQIAALRWVYENIEAFGGDPENITIFGQSAGCMSVQTLISSDLTGNMIKKAIFQSAGGYNSDLNRDFTLEEAAKVGETFAELCGVHSLEKLRDLPAEVIVQKAEIVMKEYEITSHGLCFIPVIDHYVLKAGYNELADRGCIKDIPYMAGSTKDDIFVEPEMTARGEYGTICQACINWSLKCEELGRRPAYIYYFTRELPGDQAGAFHSAELWYMFGTLKKCWRPMEERDRALSEKMLEYWTGFMKTGDPNAGSYERWKPCTKEDPFIMELIC